jgi:hypothetical protein
VQPLGVEGGIGQQHVNGRHSKGLARVKVAIQSGETAHVEFDIKNETRERAAIPNSGDRRPVDHQEAATARIGWGFQ